MSTRSVVLLLSALANAGLALYVYWRFHRKRIHRLLAALVASAAGYALFLTGLSAAQSEAVAVLWVRVAMGAAYAMIFMVYRFGVVFAGMERRPAVRWIFWVCLALASVDVLGRVSGFIPVHLARHPTQGWYPHLDLAYVWLYSPVMVTLVGTTLVALGLRWRHPGSSLERLQFGYFLLSFAFGVGISAFNHVPDARYLAMVGPLGSNLVLVYAMTRHRLLDLDLLIRQGAAAALAALLSMALIAGLILFDLQALGGNGWLPLVGGGLIFALLYSPLRDGLDRLLGRWLGGPPLDLGQELLRHSLLMGEHSLLADQMTATLEWLGRRLGLRYASLLLPDREGQWALYQAWPVGPPSLPPPVDPDGPVARRLQALPQGMDPGSLSWTRRFELEQAPGDAEDDEPSREFLALHHGHMAFGLPGRERLLGVLVLGPTASDRPLRTDELSFLAALAGQLASVVETSALHGRVEHADRLSTLGTLAASLAHELRNPLASISMFVQLLPQRGGDDEFMVKFNRIVPAELHKLTSMTDQLLDLARPATRAPRVVDLGALCLRIQQLVAHQFRKHGVVLTLGTPEGVLVQGVEEELSQVLLNLLLNAQEVSPRGATVHMALDGREGRAELVVEDQGSGLSPAQLARVFEPFYTTKVNGHGLGLATSRSLIRGSGGELLAENRAEGGARFTVRLPLAGALRPQEVGR